jgi:hypothetical protein
VAGSETRRRRALILAFAPDLADRRQEFRGAAGGSGHRVTDADLEPREPELRRLHRCFDNWRGLGDIVAGIAREEYDLELRRYDGKGWRAIFFQSGFEHSFTSHAGTAWARSPWGAVQRAAGDALRRREPGDAASLCRMNGSAPGQSRGARSIGQRPRGAGFFPSQSGRPTCEDQRIDSGRLRSMCRTVEADGS